MRERVMGTQGNANAPLSPGLASPGRGSLTCASEATCTAAMLRGQKQGYRREACTGISGSFFLFTESVFAQRLSRSRSPVE